MKVTLDVEHSHAAEAEGTSTAQDSSTAKPGSVYDRIWKLTEWYRNDSNPVIQRLRFSGRYQQDYATVDADQGDHDEWNVRRMRMGLRANLFRSLTLHGEVDLNPQEADPVYVRFTDLYLEWSTRPQLALTIGKQSVPFTADGTTSSKELVAIDRSNLANNIWFTEEYLPGISASGTAAPWVYILGAYSAGEKNKELGEFSGGIATLGSLGYDFARSLSAKEAVVSVNYVYQNPDPDNTFTKPYQHIVSLNLRFETDRWGLRSDLSTASGYFDQSNVWGVMVMPFINVTRQLQFVSRYTFSRAGPERDRARHVPGSRRRRSRRQVTTTSISGRTTISMVTSSSCRAASSSRTWRISPPTEGRIPACRGSQACALDGDE